MLVVLYVVFSNLMRVQVEHYQLFLLLGIILWNFIDRGTSMSIWGIVGKASLVQKVYRRCFVSFDHDAKVENTVDQDQIGLVSNQIHPDFLVVSESDGDNLPSVKGGQRDLLKSLPRKDALVIDNRAVKPKLWFVRLVSLVGFADLGNGSNRKLGGKTKLVSDRVVKRLMDLNLVSSVHSKNSFRYVVASLVNKPLHCFIEHLMLLLRGIKLNQQGLKQSIEYKLHWINSLSCVITAGYAPPMTEVIGIRYPCTPRSS